MLPLRKSILVLLLTLVACSQQPTITLEATTSVPATSSFTPFVAGTETALTARLASPTPWVAGTETALAVLSATPTPWVAGTETALAVSSSSATPTPVPSLTPFPTFAQSALPEGTLPPFVTFTPFALLEEIFSPVFYGSGPFLLMGGIIKDNGWVSGVRAAQYMGNEMNYDFFNPNGSIQVQGNDIEFSPTCGNHYMRSSFVLPEPMVGVASGWITEKRSITDLSTDDPFYVQAVTEWFQSQGNAPTEIHITRILQADIEGDGVNEILLSASFFKEKTFTFSTETGDYSIVLMRKVIGNNTLTIPLVKDYYVSSVPNIETSYPNTYTLAEAVDLNGDGTLEVIVDVRRWEGWGAIVYRVDGQNVREVIRTICSTP